MTKAEKKSSVTLIRNLDAGFGALSCKTYMIH
jgi:hypothetical protein